jgi:hypothetical protein
VEAEERAAVEEAEASDAQAAAETGAELQGVDPPGSALAEGTAAPGHPCADGETLATGRPDPGIFARQASRGVWAFWCETYDRDGRAHRDGPYWDRHPDGTLRTRARYVDGRIEGPVEVFAEDGSRWLRGELVGGQWSGRFELFHANGSRWLAARFRAGRLDGPVETWFSDGHLESTTRFQSGREDGVSTSYYPTAAGGGVRSRVQVEADEIVGRAEAPLAGVSRPAAVRFTN